MDHFNTLLIHIESKCSSWWSLTSVCVKTDSGMKTLAMFEDVQREQNLWALPLLLDPVEGSFQIQPETDFLQGCA